MNVEFRPVNAIKPYERNPRNNDKAVAAVAESLQQYGFRQPIVVYKDGVIVCGHTRWKASQKLGLAEVLPALAASLHRQQTGTATDPSRTGIRHDAVGAIKVDAGDTGEAEPRELDHEVREGGVVI